MEPLNIGVIGVGHLGSLHAKMLAEIADVRLVGVYDTDGPKAVRIADEFKSVARF